MKTKLTPSDIAAIISDSTLTQIKLGAKTTCVTCQLPNGFEIVATSACVDPANYDEALGRKLCLNKIEDKLWELEGYRLQHSIYESTPMSKRV